MPSQDGEDAWDLVLRETTDIEVRLRLLSFRLSVVTREKEALEARLKRLELAYDMGKGIFWVAPFLIAISAFFWYNWGLITKPWAAK